MKRHGPKKNKFGLLPTSNVRNTTPPTVASFRPSEQNTKQRATQTKKREHPHSGHAAKLRRSIGHVRCEADGQSHGTRDATQEHHAAKQCQKEKSSFRWIAWALGLGCHIDTWCMTILHSWPRRPRLAVSSVGNAVEAQYASPFTYHCVDTSTVTVCSVPAGFTLVHSRSWSMSSHTVHLPLRSLSGLCFRQAHQHSGSSGLIHTSSCLKHAGFLKPRFRLAIHTMKLADHGPVDIHRKRCPGQFGCSPAVNCEATARLN